MTDKERQDFALLHLDRVISFIPRAEGKVTSTFPVAVAMLAILALNLPLTAAWSWLLVAAWVAASGAFVCLVVCLLRIYETLFPRLSAPRMSVIYFGEMAKLREQDYVDRLWGVTSKDLADDAASQAWRNAEIAGLKFGKAKSAFLWLAGALMPWLTFLVLVTATNGGKLPVLGS